MLYERFARAEICPALPEGATEISLTAYARADIGALAGGARWGVLILPGGGYRLTSDREAEPVALDFLHGGVQAFVLHYSVEPDRWPQAFLEAAAALAFLRRSAARYGIRPDRLAVCGFSAGGHLAGCLANLWGDPIIGERLGLTPEEVRPDAAILSYPVISAGEWAHRDSFFHLTGREALPPELEKLSLEKSVTAGNPPTFLWTTDTDRTVPPENTLLYAWALRRQGVPLELHCYGHGPHAMAMATGEAAGDPGWQDEQAATWLPLCIRWLRRETWRNKD